MYIHGLLALLLLVSTDLDRLILFYLRAADAGTARGLDLLAHAVGTAVDQAAGVLHRLAVRVVEEGGRGDGLLLLAGHRRRREYLKNSIWYLRSFTEHRNILVNNALINII